MPTNGTELNNPKDPLAKASEAKQELFRRMGQVCKDFPVDAVIDAAANIVINGIRQVYPTRQKGLERMDEITANMKGVLADHYDPTTGGRRNIFPFTQNISPDTFVAGKDGFFKQ